MPKIDRSQFTNRTSWPLFEALESENICLVEDLKSRFDQVPQGSWSDVPARAAVVPIHSNIQHQLAGFIGAGLSSRLELSDGAKGYLLKAHAEIELLPAIEAVCRGGIFVSNRLAL